MERNDILSGDSCRHLCLLLAALLLSVVGCGLQPSMFRDQSPHWVKCSVHSDVLRADFLFWPTKRQFVKCVIESDLDGIKELVLHVNSGALSVATVVPDPDELGSFLYIEQDTTSDVEPPRFSKKVVSELDPQNDPYIASANVSKGLLPVCRTTRPGGVGDLMSALGSTNSEGKVNVWLLYEVKETNIVGCIRTMQIDRDCDGRVDLEFSFVDDDRLIHALLDVDCDGIFDFELFGESRLAVQRNVDKGR